MRWRVGAGDVGAGEVLAGADVVGERLLEVVGVLGQQRRRSLAWKCQARRVRKVSSASASVGCAEETVAPAASKTAADAATTDGDLGVDLERAAEVDRERDPQPGQRARRPAARTRCRGRRAPAAPAGRARPSPTAAARGRRRCGPSGRRPRSSPTGCRSATTGPGRARAAARPRRRTTRGCAASRPCRSRPRAAPCRTASAQAAPPEEPPAERVGSTGLSVVPKTGLKVCEPAANSGTLVLPMTTTPAPRTRSTMSSSGVRHVVGEQRRAVRRPPARDVVGVLERERQPVQRARRSAPLRQRLVGGRRALAGPLLVEAHDRVELGVALGDPGQVQVEQLAGGDLPGRTAAACSRAVDSTVRSLTSLPRTPAATLASTASLGQKRRITG